MVNAQRKAIESLYRDTCDVVEYEPYKKTNKTTAHREVTVLKNQPCKLSISNSPSTASTNNVATVQQVVKLFIAPEITIKSGSKVIITRNSRTTEYKNSGVPAVYSSHQEIILELFEGWA